MMKWLWVAMVLAGVAVVGIAASQESSIGITVQMEGTLREVEKRLRDDYRLWFTPVGVFSYDDIVKLDLDNATVHQLARAVGEQIGAIYRIRGGGLTTSVLLYEGDLSVDPRPKTVADPYTVAVEEITVSNSRSIEFRLGTGAADERRSLRIEFDVEPPTVEDEERLFGVWPQGSIVLDTGERLINRAGVARSHPVRTLNPGFGSGHLALTFPHPEGSPKRITQLNGVVAAFSEVTHPSCRFSPDEVGQTKQLGDVGCKLTGWERRQDEVRVTFEIPAGTDALVNASMQVDSALVGPNSETTSRGSHGQQGGNGKTVYHHRFRQVDWEPVELVIEATVWHGPMVWHNFVIEDIPLP